MPDIYEIYKSIQTFFHDNRNEFCRRAFQETSWKRYLYLQSSSENNLKGN